MHLTSLGCCGIREIQGLNTWPLHRELFTHMIFENNGNLGCAWVCFNGVQAQGYVDAFASFLEQEKLAHTIIALPQVVNPNSRNVLDVRMWHVDRDAVQAWWRARANTVCTCSRCVHPSYQHVALRGPLPVNTALYSNAFS